MPALDHRPVRRRARWTWLWLAAAALAVALLPGRARAETWSQYLIVIDDSGSMNDSDPDRLVVMASLSLAAALGERDQVMIVGLNQLAQLASGDVDGLQFAAPTELLADRDGPEGARSLTDPRIEAMTRHSGGTPCRRALAGAKTILESVSSAGAPQTLLLLTDGACTGQIEPAEDWLRGLSSHAESRFRFALLTKPERGKRVDPALLEYATATGWTAPATIHFDARSLLRAFAEVLSFSRGLRFEDEPGGLRRSYAGAREVRVLAISTDGTAPITLSRTFDFQDSAAETITGGPTFTHAAHGWSLRTARLGPSDKVFSLATADSGVDLLAIPSYGQLRVEAVVGPCPSADEDRPALPWTRERAVRSGRPACAWARLVGDSGETIHPRESFGFELELCTDEACSDGSAMQPDEDGTFNAQLGVLAEGRHERWFRAHAGSLAEPILASRSIQSLAFGITSVARADAPDEPIAKLELGVLPQALPTVVTLEYSGSFPDGGEAEVACTIAGDAGRDDPLAGELACLRCQPKPSTVALQDPFSIQVEISASSFCPMLSEGLGELPVALDLTVAGVGAAEKVGERRVPITATLRHATLEPQGATVTGGEAATAELRFPSPVNANVEFTLEPGPEARDLGDDLRVRLRESSRRITGEAGSDATVEIELEARDCCSAGDYDYTLHVRDREGGPSLAIPVTVTVAKPSFWVCPGKIILKWTLVAAGVGLLFWLVRGFTSPAKFNETAVLARAETHDALAKLGEGDEDWRLVRSLESTKRGFYKPATVHLGGGSAALPSLRGLPDDARIEARGHGNATLVVDAEGVESFRESSGWSVVSKGEHPVGSSLTLRRDDTYLMFRR